MSGYRVPLLAGLLVLGATGPASAQEERTVGLVMGAPLQVGVLWQITDRVAVRPGVSASRSSSEFGAAAFPLSYASYSSETESARVSVGASLLLFLTTSSDLRPYVAPRYGFSRTNVTSRSRLSLLSPGLPIDLPRDLLPGGLTFVPTQSETRSTQTTHEGGVVFGVQQAIGSRFRVFGEVGVTFSTSTSSASESTGTESSGTAVGTTGGVGVVWMF